MHHYTDGFVLPIHPDHLERYRAMAATAGRIWLEHGALDFKECALDDSPTECALPFARGIGAREGETVVFSWISYESREHRDAVNQRVMADPRMHDLCPGQGAETPFDPARMLYGGFRVLVDARAGAPAKA